MGKIKKDIFYSMIGQLSLKELMILYRRKIERKTFDDVAKEFVVTRERIRQVEAKCEEKIMSSEIGVVIPSDRLSARVMQFLEDNNCIDR